MILQRRNIFIALGAVIILEIIWAGFTLFKPATINVATQSSVVPTVKQQLSEISLQTPKNQIKVGEKFTVSINISSSKKSDGADLIIKYDPQLLSVETTGLNKIPVIVGTIYSDYPSNNLDEKVGRITVSGITEQRNGVSTNGLFGSLVFRSKAKGRSKVTLDFTPGSTVDSNIIESGTGKDVLEKVNNLEVNIE